MITDLKQSIMQLRYFTLQQLQQEFGASYDVAKQCVDEMLSEGLVYTINKTKYAVRQRSRRVISPRETLQGIYSDADCVEIANIDACIAEQFHGMQSSTRSEMKNILHSAVPENLPVTESVQIALEVIAFFSDESIRLLWRGLQFGKEKLRCIYYVLGEIDAPNIKNVTRMYKRERKGRLCINAIYKFLPFGLFVLDFAYDEALPVIAKQAAEILVTKVPRYKLPAIRQELGCNVSDFYRSIIKLVNMGLLNTLPAQHGSVAYEFSVEPMYRDYLMPNYLWHCKSDNMQTGE